MKNRKSIRLVGYDYSSAGAYFVTICAAEKKCLFGQINEGKMILNEYGRAAAESWEWLMRQYEYLKLDKWTIMPNHLHGIITIDVFDREGGSRTAPTKKVKPLGRLIGAFKTISTKRINELRQTPADIVWQRNYYEHIIRDENELNRICEYIINNHLKWELDIENIRRGGSRTALVNADYYKKIIEDKKADNITK